MLKETIEKVSSMSVKEIISYLIEHGIDFGLKLIAAILIYIIGIWIIRKIKNLLKKILEKREVDPSLTIFLTSFVAISLTVILILVTINTLGVDISSIVAILAGSGVAIGMALSGTLQNFSGGIMILLFKPFKVGDFIEAQGYTGTVKSIQITSTYIATEDNKTIILPNGKLSNDPINNFSSSGTRRCEWKISISYGDDINIAKDVVIEILKNDPRVLNKPEGPFASLYSMDDSCIVVIARAWVKSKNYFPVIFDTNEKIYTIFPEKNLHFPFPQIDVHINND